MMTGKDYHLISVSKENNDQIGALYTSNPIKLIDEELIIKESISQKKNSGAIPQIFTQESLDFSIASPLPFKNSTLFQLSQIHAPWARLMAFYHLNNITDQQTSLICNYKGGSQKLEFFSKEKIQELIKKEEISSSFNLKWMFNYHHQLNFLKSQLNECQIRIEKEEFIENKKQIINEYRNQINITKKLIDNPAHLTKNNKFDSLFLKILESDIHQIEFVENLS